MDDIEPRRTERLVVRPLIKPDLEPIAAYLAQPAVYGLTSRIYRSVAEALEVHFIEESFHHEFGWVDGMVYAMLAPEWRARKVEQ